MAARFRLVKYDNLPRFMAQLTPTNSYNWNETVIYIIIYIHIY